MSLTIGNKEISSMFAGGKEVKSVWLGNVEVWSSGYVPIEIQLNKFTLDTGLVSLIID